MSWRNFKNVAIGDVFISAGWAKNQYRLVLETKSELGIGNDYFHIDIQNSDLKAHLERLVKGETLREYFAFGMTDIDVFRKGEVYYIDHSPISGCHDVYELKKGEMERLIQLLSLSTERERALEKILETIVDGINHAKDDGSVVLAEDWNEDLRQLGIKEVETEVRISVSERI